VRSGHVAVLPALLALARSGARRWTTANPRCTWRSRRLARAVEALLAGGARVDVVDFGRRDAAARAVRDGADAIAERLQRAVRCRRSRSISPSCSRRSRRGGRRRCREADPRCSSASRGLIRARSLREHRCTLLHYAAANGVEAERQRTPPNAPAVAQLLLARGADPDAFALTTAAGRARPRSALRGDEPRTPTRPA